MDHRWAAPKAVLTAAHLAHTTAVLKVQRRAARLGHSLVSLLVGGKAAKLVAARAAHWGKSMEQYLAVMTGPLTAVHSVRCLVEPTAGMRAALKAAMLAWKAAVSVGR